MVILPVSFDDAYGLQVFDAETVLFQQLPEIVNRFLMPPDPIVLHYLIKPGTVPPDRPAAWDVEVKLDDLSLKSRMKSATLEANPTTTKKLAELDDEVSIALPYIA